MNDILTEAQRTLARLSMENALLRAQNRKLRRLTVNRGEGKVLSAAREDAKALLVWRFAGYAVTRRACRDLGMSERRWEWARAMLLAARVWDMFENDVHGDYEDDFDAAVAAVERAAERMAAQGNIDALKMRRRRYQASFGASNGASLQAHD